MVIYAIWARDVSRQWPRGDDSCPCIFCLRDTRACMYIVEYHMYSCRYVQMVDVQSLAKSLGETQPKWPKVPLEDVCIIIIICKGF